jgi:hypothetical protein
MAPWQPNFAIRSEYRAPNRNANNDCGTEGCRAPGNLPRIYGQLNSEISKLGTNIPSPTGKEREPILSRWEDRTPLSRWQDGSEGWMTPLTNRKPHEKSPPFSYRSKNVACSRHTSSFSEDAYDEGFM